MKKRGSKRGWIHRIINSENEISVFNEIPLNIKGFVLLALPRSTQKKILQKLHNKDIMKMLHYLDPDQITDILPYLGSRRQSTIINAMHRELRKKVESLLKFDPDTAAGLMSLDYIEVEKDIKLKDLVKKIKIHEKNTGKFPTVLVVEEGYLLGEIMGHNLMLAKSDEKVVKYITKIPSIKYNEDKKEVVSIFERNPHHRVAVIDEDDSVLGVINSDDVLPLLQRESTRTLYNFAGLQRDEDVHDSVSTKVYYRYKWLILNLATAFLAAGVVALFQDTISKLVLLAVYMPIIAGMGGNTGTQALAVMVRGIALKEVDLKTGSMVVMKEMIAGCFNGFITGVLVALVTWIFNQNMLLGLIVGISMVINLAIAGFFGAVIPLIMKRLGKDPATSATIFITTATDLFGFFVFLGLASLVI